jgi:hypothetical protein
LAASLTSLVLRLPKEPEEGDYDDEKLTRQLAFLGRLTALRELVVFEGRADLLADALPSMAALTSLCICTDYGGIYSAADMEALATAPALCDLIFDQFMLEGWGPTATLPGVTRLVCSGATSDIGTLQEAFPNVRDVRLTDSLPELEAGARTRWRDLRRLSFFLPCHYELADTPEDAAAIAAAAASVTPWLERLGALDGALEELELDCYESCVLGAAELRAILQASPLLASLTFSCIQLAPGALAACAPHAGLRKLRLDPSDLAPASDESLAQLLDAGRAFPALQELVVGGENTRVDFRPAAQAWTQRLDARFGGVPVVSVGGEEEGRPAWDQSDFSTPGRGLLRAIRGALQREAAAAKAEARAPQRGRSRKQRAR